MTTRRASRLGLGRVLRAALPFALLALVLWHVDLRDAALRIARAAPGPLLSALALAHVVIVASALRWADTARRIGGPIPRRAAIGEYYVSSLLNQILPGGITGDVARAWRARPRLGLGPAARGVVIERLSGQVAMAVALLAGLAISSGAIADTAAPVGAFLALLAAILAALVLGSRLPGRARDAFAGFAPDLRRAWFSPGAALVQGALNLAVTGALIGGFALCARAVGTPLGIGTALVLIPVCLAAMLLPVGVGGLGLREGTAAAFWPLAGFDAEAGVAAALLFGLCALVAALPGAVLLSHRHEA